jgi:hypothetical protein
MVYIGEELGQHPTPSLLLIRMGFMAHGPYGLSLVNLT